MATAELAIPELGEILTRLNRIENCILRFMQEDKTANASPSPEFEWYSRPQFRQAFHIGNEKIDQLVDENMIERNDARGRRGIRYRWKQEVWKKGAIQI